MATQEKPSQSSWEVQDLFVLGEKGNTPYLKAIPVLILELWVRRERKEDEANFVRRTTLENRLVDSGLVPGFKPKGSSQIIAALGVIQKSRNLTRPPLVTGKRPGGIWVNLPHYEPLLQKYRQRYRERYPEDYKKLFPEGEPEWEAPTVPAERAVAEPELTESERQDKIERLLAPIQQALHNQLATIEGLTEERQRLQAELEARANESPEVRFVHTSPDFRLSEYGGKVTSIRDTIADMLKRAEHAVRISTRQMDMFADEPIHLKRLNSDIEITVLSRGPEGAVGDRKKLAGDRFDKMKDAGIKMVIEKDSLHSRLVVIDVAEALVSSADLDYTQMEAEFNAGIWTNNPGAVAEAIRYFDNLLRYS